ncbi:helix-turn-helix transcriptional regulator [Kitasatospora herbaricolor]|uniref:Helix-turn-helix transcriptional regulator n=1 Tax=Kitasatospora herbaricolor TaxID=68217 RepID=A0ABZ1W928_9ACTN|nr:helix-turn-helix transcriptional regulator [Kitasatospora herbaricolor]
MAIGDISGLTSTPELSETAHRVYAYAVNRMRFSPEELEAALGLPAETAEQVVDELERLHLVGRIINDDRQLTPVAPQSAAARVLAPMENLLRDLQLTIDRTRCQILALEPEYHAGAAHLARIERVELVTDLASVRAIIQDAAHRCLNEVLTAQPGGGRRTEVLAEAAARDEEMLARGVAMRTIYQHTARYSPPTIAYVEHITALGGQVRTTGDRVRRMLVFDRSVAVIEVQENPDAALVIREPNIIDFMRATFEQSWLRGLPFATSVDRAQASAISDDLRQAIISLLSLGMDDKSIARRLGMSDRTCQRHISDIMSRIGAKSRFQAGYLIRDRQGPDPARPPDGAAA